jgi:hypothetical protein
VTSVVGPEGGESGIGAALAAAADSDNRLRPEVSFWSDYKHSISQTLKHVSFYVQVRRQLVTWQVGYRKNTTTDK